jgi:hypothetical protein
MAYKQSFPEVFLVGGITNRRRTLETSIPIWNFFG